MATIIPNLYPIDTQSSTAVGFGFPLNGNAVFTPTYKTRDQIKANLVNYILTNKGERVMNPNFGSNLKTLLFNNNLDTTTEDLRERIQDEISSIFPEVIVKQVTLDNIPDSNTINFTLTYQIVLLGLEESVNILLQ